MKFKCINSAGYEGRLTKEKVYAETESEDPKAEWITITFDDGSVGEVFAERFEEVKGLEELFANYEPPNQAQVEMSKLVQEQRASEGHKTLEERREEVFDRKSREREGRSTELGKKLTHYLILNDMHFCYLKVTLRKNTVLTHDIDNDRIITGLEGSFPKDYYDVRDLALIKKHDRANPSDKWLRKLSNRSLTELRKLNIKPELSASDVGTIMDMVDRGQVKPETAKRVAATAKRESDMREFKNIQNESWSRR